MTDKLAGGENSVGGYFETAWNYTTDWRTVDTTASIKSEGNWTSREIITGCIATYHTNFVQLVLER